MQVLSYFEQGPPAAPLEHDNRIVNYMTGGNYVVNYPRKRTRAIEYLFCLLYVCCVFQRSLRHHQHGLFLHSESPLSVPPTLPIGSGYSRAKPFPI